MLFKYNDGHTTYILQSTQPIDVDNIDYINDITEDDDMCVCYMQDGKSIIPMTVMAYEASTEEPRIEVL